MSDDVNPASQVIDLCTPCDEQYDSNSSNINDVVVVTPHRKKKYSYIDDITTAISRPSYSAMYPDESSNEDVEIVEDVNTVVTPNKCNDDCTNQMTSTHPNLSPLIIKDSYYRNNPILAEMGDKIFNDTFTEFYAKLEQYSKIGIDLIKIRMTEHDVVSYVYSLICYTKSKKESDAIYDLFCKFDRSYMPIVIVTNASSYYAIYEDDDGTDREIVTELKLENEFKRLLDLFEDTETSVTYPAITNDTNEVMKEDVSQVTAIVPYVNPRQRKLSEESLFDDGISYPKFYRKLMTDSSLSHEQLEQKFLNLEWLTESLMEEIIDHSPSSSDGLTNDQDFNSKKYSDAFEKHCRALFPKGRRFANYKQLDEFLTLFLESWKIRKFRQGFVFKCFYSPNSKKRKAGCLFRNESEQNDSSIKEKVNCPFVIRFSMPGIKKKLKPPIFHVVRITFVNPSHLCQFSPQSYNVAKRKSTSIKKIELSALSVVIQCIKVNPHLPSNHLRSLLASCLPLETSLSSDYVRNFRKRCNLYIASNVCNEELDLSISNKLLSSDDVSSFEIQVLESPKIYANYREIYSRIMHNGQESWKALALLKDLRHNLTGFDFRIRLNNDKLPVGLVWVTYTMRQRLLQYGDIIFLDAQKRQYNKLCWPYIGPTIRTNENTNRVIAESVVISEDIDTYVWILQSIQDMEPKWNVKNVRLIFADGLISQSLLQKLGIEVTCTLRSDYWHLMKEVFPKTHNFGTVCFEMIKNHLQTMLLSNTSEEWDNAYNDAIIIIRDYPLKLEKLKEIYDRPSYYAGYYVREIYGNLLLVGNSAAESNHASITQHLGHGGEWTICEQITKLMDRQQYFINIDRQKTDDLFVRKNYFTSKFDGDLSKHDSLAKKHLSDYAYQHCWIKPLNRSKLFKSQLCGKQTHHIIWKVGENLNVNNFVHIPINGKCICKYRMAYGCPCAHERLINKEFKAETFSKRWFCSSTFARLFPHIQPSIAMSHTHNETDFVNSNIVLQPDIMDLDNAKDAYPTIHLDELPQHCLQSPNGIIPKSRSVQFNELTRVAHELIRSVINDSEMSRNVFTNLIQWTDNIRKKEKFEIIFHNSSNKKTTTDEMTTNATVQNPLTASTKTASTVAASRRMISTRERNRISKSGRNQECTQIPKGRSFSKSCALCRGKGHTKMKCIKLLQEFGKFPVPLTDTSQRNKIGHSLNSNQLSGTPVFHRSFSDERLICKEFPKNVKCLVIHQKFLINQNVTSVSVENNVCVECTIIRNNYEIDSNERKMLFEPATVLRYVLGHHNMILSQI